MKKQLAILAVSAVLIPFSVVFGALPATSSAIPTVSTIVKTSTTSSSGSVSGDYSVTIEGSDFCVSSTSDVVSATVGSVALTNITVTCGSPDSLVGTIPAQALADRELGAFPVVVTNSAGESTGSVFFSFVPDVDLTYAMIQQTELINLGDLFSRTQRQPVVRSRTAPYTVSGTDYLTGEPYTYVTNYDYYFDYDSGDYFNCDPLTQADYEAEYCGAYAHEPDLGEPTHMGSLDPVVLDDDDPATDLVVTHSISVSSLNGTNTSGSNSRLSQRSSINTAANSMLAVNDWLDGRNVVELFSDLDCGPNTDGTDRSDLGDPDIYPSGAYNYFDSGDGDGAKYTFCAGFGPDIYSEPFVATAGKSLAFEWAAIGASDDYAVYAYLVKVDPTTGDVPETATEQNHELVMYSSGSRLGTSDWNTSTADVTESGMYRFRFINGSFDGTGGYRLGSLFYLSELFLAGNTNTITFGPFDDRVVQTSDTFVIPATSTAGGEVSVITLSPNVCTIASLNTTPPTYTVTVVATDDTCILQASQGAVGEYAPAASVIGAIELRSTATTPQAPTLVTVTPGDAQLALDWNAGPTGGSAITNYEYSTDNGTTWTTISPASTTTDLTITGLTNGTTYDIKVRAVNAQGVGLASNMLQGTPAGSGSSAPAAPYAGPIVQPVDPQVPKAPAGTARFTGSKLDEITKVVIDGTTVPFKMVGSQLELTLPPGIKPGFYDVQVSGGFGVLNVLRAVNVLGVTQTPDIGKKMWTNINAEKTSVRVIYKNPVGVGKVQFTLNGVEIAWVRAVDDTDPKLRKYTLEGVEIPYLVRNVVLTPGIKNAFEIYVDGVRVWRAAYYSGN